MSTDKIVISGISGSFPNCGSVKDFGDKLNAKTELIDDDDRRWNLIHPEICNYTGKIDDLEKFDAGFFGVHNRHADTMDPMMRVLLEKSVESIMDAGVNPGTLKGTRTGVFVGVCYSESEQTCCRQNLRADCFSAIGCQRSMIANRLSYHLKLQGRSHTTDTACSSSLFALEHAVRAIKSGECDKAIVGGCNLCLHPYVSLQFSRLGVLNKDGKCKSFDDTADGYTRSEAVGAVFLERAKDAKRIYCEVVHSKTNCDGYKEEGITFPSSKAQETLMNEVYEECGVSPLDLSFLETHGTGTIVGDPQELDAISKVFLKGRDRRLMIGSVKSNVGHSEPSSGLVSIAKVILGMETGLIPPNLHYNTPRIGVEGLENGKFKVVTEPTPFDDDRGLVAINNFGFGGGNCHILLRWNTKTKVNAGRPLDDLPRLVCVSGRGEKAVNSILDYLESRPVDAEFVGLLHEVFKFDIPEHYHRGFSIVSKTGARLARSVKNVDPDKFAKYLVFSNFGVQWLKIFNELKDLEPAKSSIVKIKSTASEVGLELDKTLKVGNSGLEIIGSAILQLVLVDILKSLNLKFDESFANDSLSEVACNYYKGGISLEECFVILKKFSTNKSAKVVVNNNKNKSILESNSSQSPSVILELGKELHINKDSNEVLTCYNLESFLRNLGRLYELGADLDLSKLYPGIEFPVSRGTPMLSHLIKWNHTKDWFVPQFKEQESFTKTSTLNDTISLDLELDEFRYVTGHTIDGRVLFPATGYLHIVWEIYAQAHGIMLDVVPVIFENCKFLRAVNFGASGKPNISVMIQQGSGDFEITHDEAVVVCGRIRFPKSDEELDFIKFPDADKIESNNVKNLNTKDIYKELRLRGYNYSGAFKKIVECNPSITKAKLRWERRWVAFLDNMLQIKILQEDTRCLYVPTEIKKFTIDPNQFLKNVCSLGANPEITVFANKQFDIIQCEGVQIAGLTARSIPRRKPTADPLIEKYQFVPNVTKLSLRESAKVNSQIVLENSPAFKVKVVELLDEATGSESELLSPLIYDVLTNLPLIQAECTVLSKSENLEVQNASISKKDLHSESDCTLVIISEGLQRPKILSQAFKILKPKGFVISREKLSSPLNRDAQTDIITIHTTSAERLILIREKSNVKIVPNVVHIKPKDFSWVPHIQKSLRKKEAILLTSQDFDSGIIGFVNCLRREYTSDKIGCVFVQDDAAPQFDHRHPFYLDQVEIGLALNVYKNGEWGTYRHLDLDETVRVERGHSYLNTLERGDLSSLRWIEGPLKATDQLTGDRQLVHVYYASLNFRDIMSATGRINVDVLVRDRRLQEIVQGIEFAGRTSDGRRVIGMVSGGALSTLVAGDGTFNAEIPEQWSMEEGATVPVVYSTVIYALLDVTRMKKGDSVLIHSGTGGIGLAAITLALYYGCEVFTTVGSKEKRDFLKNRFPQLRDDHIGNSRDITFEDMVKTQTNGKGVDFVLNSLVEEKLEASVRCLARGGHFLEIGKFDISNNRHLQLQLFAKEASLHGIMLDNIVLGGMEMKLRIMNALREHIRNGSIQPLPTTIFKEDQAEKAFRYMTTGKHIGKVLIEMRPEEDVPRNQHLVPTHQLSKAIPKYWCNSEGSYVIVGGLGGFGMELADWLVLRGAQNLILTSRRGISTGYHTYRINLWKSYGINVQVLTEDVTTKSGCETILKKAASLGPIDAIFNLAAVLKDALFENQTPESFAESAKPKADATRHLDELSRRICPNLRSFVVFSSVSCGRGNAGQTNYGLSNSVMERICEKRRSEGLPGLAIQWGAIGEVGLVADMQDENIEIEIGGTLQQRIANCLEILDRLLNQSNAIVSSMVVSENRRAMATGGSMLDVVANIIGIKNLKTVSHHATLSELGMDSMSGVEIKQILERDFDIALTPQALRSLTLDKLKQLEEATEDVNLVLPKENGVTDENDKVVDIVEEVANDETTARLPYVHFKTRAHETEERRIVFFPGIEGVHKTLQRLASNLEYQASCVHYDLFDPAETILDLVRRVLPSVKKLTTGKEFRLVGYSFGAIIALEVASILELEGYTGTVICLDGTPLVVANAAKKIFNFTTEAQCETNIIVHVTNFTLHKTISTNAREKLLECSNLDERIKLSLTMLSSRASDKVVAYMKATFIAAHLRYKDLDKYRPKYAKIRSSVKLYRANELMDASAPKDYGLSELCENVSAVEEFVGTHTTFLGDAALAARINDDFAPSVGKTESKDAMLRIVESGKPTSGAKLI